MLDAGHGTVPLGSEYPLPGHPEDHEFTWEKGRCLDAYTFVYITAGSGTFDSEPSGEVPVEAGSVFLVFPNVWHRYRPLLESGWDEYWVECEGEQLEAAVRRCGMVPESPVMRVGHDDALLRCFLNIAETIKQGDPGFEPIIAMRSLEIVARIRSLLKISGAAGVTTPEKLVKQVQLRMRKALGESVDFHELKRHRPRGIVGVASGDRVTDRHDSERCGVDQGRGCQSQQRENSGRKDVAAWTGVDHGLEAVVFSSR